mgnify:CR=1 FL=1
MKFDLSIIVPVKDESKNIDILVKEIEKKIINIKKLQLFFVDDGSKDNSWEKIKLSKFLNKNHKVSGIKLNKNYGKDLALYSALDRVDSKYVAFYDCDMQFDLKYINMMYSTISKKNIDLVQGRKNKRDIKLSSKIFYKVFNYLTGFHFDGDTYLKMFTNDAKNKILRYKESNLFIRGVFKLINLKSFDIEVKISERKFGESKYNFFKLSSLALNAITSFSNIPLRVISVIGIILIFISLLILSRIIYIRFTYGLLDGLTTFYCLFILTSGFIITILGLIAEYISKIYEEIKMRPKFIIDDKK